MKEELEGFEEVWAAYPRKVGKGDAKRAWKKIGPDSELRKRMIETLKKMARCEQWTRDGGQFIPHPATWLNREGWEDEPEIAKAAPPPRQQLAPCADCDKEGVYPLGGSRYCAEHYMAHRPSRAA